MRGITIREELTDEWQKRGAEEKKDYEILTAEISKATFGERPTTEIHRTEDSKGVPKLKEDAKAGGNIAGNARKELEKKLGKSIVTKENFLTIPKPKKQLPRKSRYKK